MSTVRRISPDGRAAIAVLEVRGPGAAAVVERALGRAAGDVTVARIEGVDEVVATRAGEDAIEVCTHGGPATVARVEAALRAAGAEGAAPAAVPLAARTRTWLGFRMAMRWGEGDPRLGVFVEPRRVVLSGKPNAGKSSLFNALLERERAIVSEEPGTTRDVIEEETAFEGVPVRLCDAAGVGDGIGHGQSCHGHGPEHVHEHDPIAEVAQERARQAASGADLVIDCVDGSVPVHVLVSVSVTRLLVLTKSDLPHAFPTPPGALRVSAKTGEGLDALSKAIANRIWSGE